MQLIQKLHMKGTTLIDKHTKERTDSRKSTRRCLHYTKSPCNHKETGYKESLSLQLNNTPQFLQGS